VESCGQLHSYARVQQCSLGSRDWKCEELLGSGGQVPKQRRWLLKLHLQQELLLLQLLQLLVCHHLLLKLNLVLQLDLLHHMLCSGGHQGHRCCQTWPCAR
jgi:hypothetical protein